MLRDREVEQFWRDGYLIVRDVFSPDEIERFRDVVGELAERLPSPTSTGGAWVLPGDMMAFPELSNVVVEERLVGIAQTLLGERPVYFRDSDAVVEGSTRGWHKDNRTPDRYDPTAVDWQGRYPIIRMGIYCEDHVRHSGGLSLRVGSHEARRPRGWKRLWDFVHRVRPRPGVRARAYGINAGRPIHVGTRAGDVVVWTLRTTHSAYTLRPRFAKELKLSPTLENRLPSLLFRPQERRRIVLFLTYGADSDHLWRLVDYLLTRDYFRERNLKDPVSEKALQAVAARPETITLLDPESRLSEETVGGAGVL